MTIYIANSTAPVNIATLKYWGKRDVELNLPTNSSISVTLDQEDLKTFTSVATSKDIVDDSLWLNGEKQAIENNKRLRNCLIDLRLQRRALEDNDSTLPKLSTLGLNIVSENNFPTAAGLASSASGFAALVYTIAKLYQLKISSSDLSLIARKGSGSACRSLLGGFVAWDMGNLEDGSDSKAFEIASKEHWPEMKAAILVVSDLKKDIPSTSGMQLTVKTSTLFKERIDSIVPDRFKKMQTAICSKDFETFANLTMMDSNSFHAVCLDSFPPIFYLTDTSKMIIKLIHLINEFYNETIVAYTFDAGPNAVLYYLEKNEVKLMSFIYTFFSALPGWDEKFGKDQLLHFTSNYSENIKPRLSINIDSKLFENVRKVILTRVGPGPQDTNETLIDDKTGYPKSIK
ncbi:hypothetical protein TBLA_0F04250 [Henningerozyma blattae CBS 6284]|uniref:Diphosphomevalonate decarboxylase n=1 Tax=Henningerozyma blattae (strain ATCC 34711 / CBS 6284 / DSM 70876 / NBRC 10599 / NRRL Y-10934 / UCD 77-7) TaxID=1071380 RepID=I2H6F6_HENB6|nr:hypothetical protein TBLA_0F04250 [Tetrapisispora blattae CBS 6284]CCH61958.1 hypothetical protein TBLA_0F04250 [Tetrapisispora blattae CBS 6284]